MPVHSPGHDYLSLLACRRPRRAAQGNYNSHSTRVLTSRMAEQKRLCRTRCRACSFCGGSSPLRCSRSSSSTARDTSAERGGDREGTRGQQEGRPRSGWKRSTRPAGPLDPNPRQGVLGALRPRPSHAHRPQAAPRPPRLRPPPAFAWLARPTEPRGRTGSPGALTPLQPQRLHQRSHVAANTNHPPRRQGGGGGAARGPAHKCRQGGGAA